MFKRIIPFTFFLVLISSLAAQNIRKVVFETPIGHSNTASARVPCPDNMAGTINLGALNAGSQSNSTPTKNEVTYLCFGDSFNSTHNRDGNITSDPDATTAPGIGYAIYTCEPTEDGPDITTILGDCLLGDPATADDILIAANATDPLGGNEVFANDQNPALGTSFQQIYNQGDPIQLWFAPITFDGLDNNGRVRYEGNPSGPCVSASIGEWFSVVYLNQIEILNTVYPFGGNDGQARLNIKGGLPEFDPTENYTITVQNIANPNITGTVLDGPHGNRSFPTVQVPEDGDYRISITDSRGCQVTSDVITFSNVQNNTATLISSGGTFIENQEACIDVTTENFNDFVSFFFAVHWDTTLFDFRRIDFTDAFLKEGDVIVQTDSIGYALVNFLDPSVTSNALPDGSKLFSICFLAKAEGTTAITFTNDPKYPINGPPMEVIPGEGQPYTPMQTNGEITIINPNRLTATISHKDACPSENNGSVEISVVGGEAPYEITLLGPKNDGPVMNVQPNEVVTFSNLPPGDYEVLIRPNDLGTFTRETFTIETANLFVDAMVVTPVTCSGDSNGAMGLTVRKNGIEVTDLSEYSFVWTNFAGDTVSMQENAINLPSDNQYTVIVTDPNGCNVQNGTGLPQTNPITLDLSIIQQPTCSGVADGSIEVSNINGGLPPFNYSWSNNVNTGSNAGIEEGKYIVSVTDANGCQVIDSTQLVATTSINTNPLLSHVQCFGDNNGEITLTATITGPTTPSANGYVFTWSPNAPINSETGIRSLLSNLGQGDYTVTVTHPELPAGCQATETYSINEPDSLIIDSIAITPVSSCTVSDGSARVFVSGGTITADYQYTWTDPNGQNTQTATGLAADSITIFVNDDNACNARLDTIIGTPPPPVVQFFDNDSLNCASDIGNLQVIASTGRPGVNIRDYMWSHDNSINRPNAGNLSPGVYYVTIVDEDECATLDSALVYSPPTISIDTTIFTMPCFGANDGRISVNVSGGTPNMIGQPYIFEWSTGFNNSVLAGVESGDYDLKITDANACEFDTTITLDNLPRITVNFNGITGVDCFDNVNPADCNGAATAIATYEDGSTGTFDFFWNTGESVSGTDQTSSNNLCAGMQELIINDGQCQVTEMVEIPSPPALLYDIDNSTIVPVTCFNGNDGSAAVAATGGTPGYTFAWPDGSAGPTISGVTAGTYELTITDNNNCITTHNLDISEPPALTVGLDFDNTSDVTCAGDDDGRIQVLVMGGNQGTLDYAWTNNVSNGPSAAGLAPGLYLIDVTDSKGCAGSTQYTVAEPPTLLADVEFDPIQCFGFQTTIRVTNLQGGNGAPYQFSVDNSPPQGTDIVVPVFGGDHLVSVFDSRGCQIDINESIFEPTEVTVDFPNNIVEVDLGSSTTLEPTISSSVPIANLVWTSNGGAVDSSFICNSVLCDNPTVSPLENQNYTLMVTDQNGCMAEGSIAIEVDKNRNVYIPNVFAPNNTGFDTNDRFEIFTGSGVKSVNYARVFNRWGMMVAELDTPVEMTGNGQITLWDGTFNGEKANQGVYIYIIEVEFIDKQPDNMTNTKLLYRGDVTLLR